MKILFPIIIKKQIQSSQLIFEVIRIKKDFKLSEYIEKESLNFVLRAWKSAFTVSE